MEFGFCFVFFFPCKLCRVRFISSVNKMFILRDKRLSKMNSALTPKKSVWLSCIEKAWVVSFSPSYNLLIQKHVCKMLHTFIALFT